jgi:hypothetical protein
MSPGATISGAFGLTPAGADVVVFAELELFGLDEPQAVASNAKPRAAAATPIVATRRMNLLESWT